MQFSSGHALQTAMLRFLHTHTNTHRPEGKTYVIMILCDQTRMFTNNNNEISKTDYHRIYLWILLNDIS